MYIASLSSIYYSSLLAKILYTSSFKIFLGHIRYQTYKIADMITVTCSSWQYFLYSKIAWIKSSHAESFVFAYAYPITKHYRQGRARKLLLYGNTKNLHLTVCVPTVNESQKGDYTSFSEVFNTLQNALSNRIT